MSIDIDWDTLTTGPEGIELANSIRDFIHDKFQQVQLPRFIRSVHVHSFDFGKECPVVELKDISDPLPEFYEDEAEDSEDDEEVDGDPPEVETSEDSNTLRSTPSIQSPPTTINRVPTTTATRPRHIDTHHHNIPPLRSNFAFQDQPFLSSRATTPGIPGGTSNFSYFHLPLSSAGLSGTQSPLVAAATPFTPVVRHDQQHHHHLQNPPFKRQPQHAFPDPSSRPSTAHGGGGPTSAATFTSLQQEQQQREQEPDTRNSTTDDNADRTQDLQTTLHISYTGSLSLSLTAEILLDYPMPSFVGIPLKLQITGLSFDGVALLAYLRQPTQGQQQQEEEGGEGRNKVHFCFLGEEDAKVMVGAVNADDNDSNGAAKQKSTCSSSSKSSSKSSTTEQHATLLKQITIETQIGRQETGKQVLKNVGKVERFVLEQVRKIVDEEVVWPSFWTFLV